MTWICCKCRCEMRNKDDKHIPRHGDCDDPNTWHCEDCCGCIIRNDY